MEIIIIGLLEVVGVLSMDWLRLRLRPRLLLRLLPDEGLEPGESPSYRDDPREPGESPSDFAKRMVGYAAIVFSMHDSIMSACNLARNTDAQIREIMDDFQDTVIDKIVGLVKDDTGARPVSTDLVALVRTLIAMTSMTLAHDSAFVGRNQGAAGAAGAVEIVERLWLSALWGGPDSGE